MNKMKIAFALALLTVCSSGAIAQTGKPRGFLAETDAAQSDHEADKRTVPLDPQRERQALRIFLKSVQDQIVSADRLCPLQNTSSS